ncbi:hypothetical protein PCAR4_1370002 [Paraburkholderia caribensis]|nr:hypothetical protein PCAR4_1370002 [Paraburkholderia caribensis]
MRLIDADKYEFMRILEGIFGVR